MDGMGPRGVPRPDMHHRGQSHETLKAMTDAGMPAVSEGIADEWRSMGDGLEQAGILLQQAVFGSESGWTGQAADAMRYRLGQVADWSMKAGEGFSTASSAVREQSGAVGEAKNRMPDPVPYDPDQIFNEAMADGLPGIITLPQRMYTQWQKHQAAHDEAVTVVAGRDMQLAAGAATIPAFGPPPQLNEDGGGSDDDGSRDPGDGSGGDRGIVGGPGGPGGGEFGSGTGGGPDGGSGSTGPGQTGRDPQLTNPDRDTTGPPGGRPIVPVGPGPGPGAPGGGPGLGPGVGFLPGAGFGPGGGAALGSGGGSGGGGARGVGSGAGAGGGPGRGMGGATRLGPGAAAAEAAAGGRGAAGARGGAGMAGMPMGARGKGDDDTEHQRPTYLQEPDPESLFGTDEVTAPPVIGEE